MCIKQDPTHTRRVNSFSLIVIQKSNDVLPGHALSHLFSLATCPQEKNNNLATMYAKRICLQPEMHFVRIFILCCLMANQHRTLLVKTKFLRTIYKFLATPPTKDPEYLL